MLTKDKLKHGRWYVGRCRNSNVAMWNGQREVFVYIREKLGDIFLEEIQHIEDEKYSRTDAFRPMKLLYEVLFPLDWEES
jgi:hypothetical protein